MLFVLGNNQSRFSKLDFTDIRADNKNARIGSIRPPKIKRQEAINVKKFHIINGRVEAKTTMKFAKYKNRRSSPSEDKSLSNSRKPISYKSRSVNNYHPPSKLAHGRSQNKSKMKQ